MAGLVAVIFIVLVFGLLMAYFLGDRFMKKATFIVAAGIGIVLFVMFMFWLSITLFVLAWNLSVAAYFGLAALTFWKGFGFIWVGGILCKGESMVQSLINCKNKKK